VSASRRLSWSPLQQEQLHRRLSFRVWAHLGSGASAPSPRHAASYIWGTWVRNPNATRETCARIDSTTRMNTAMVLRDQGRRCPRAACVMRNNRHLFGHRMTLSGTPMRSSSASLPSTPSARRQSGLSPS
jgi:hypothetical protein